MLASQILAQLKFWSLTHPIGLYLPACSDLLLQVVIFCWRGWSPRSPCVHFICFTACWCNHNNNENNTTRNWIILLNIISIKKGITQHYLDWGATLALFKEIQALGWLNLVTGADLLWLVSPRIQQPNKCCMARTTSVQSVKVQSFTRKNTLPCQESLFFSLCVLYVVVTWIGSEWVYL